MTSTTTNDEQPTLLPPLRLKLLFFGPPNTGKSCIIKRLAQDKFVSRYVPTIGVDYGVLRPDVEDAVPAAKLVLLNSKAANAGGGGGGTTTTSANARANIFDLGGDEAYTDVRSEFYRDMHGVSVKDV